MGETAERGGDDHRAPELQKTRQFAQRRHRLGQVLQNLGAQDGIERGVRLGNCGDIANDINRGSIPMRLLQAD